MTTLRQQTANCSDFDVTLGNGTQPSFRVLLPEWIRGEGVRYPGLLHVIPGIWKKNETGVSGRFKVADQLDIAVDVMAADGAIDVILEVKNVGDCAISNVYANVCTSVNHLPGVPGWSNELFIPGIALDRTKQGRYWFEVVTPRRLQAFTGRRWIAMHPCPEDPDAAKVPLYSFTPSPTAQCCACAVESPSGGVWFYQLWSTPCRWCTPCPGNACMHLEPFLAGQLPVGASTNIHGRIGIHEGDVSSLEKMLARLQKKTALSGQPSSVDA